MPTPQATAAFFDHAITSLACLPRGAKVLCLSDSRTKKELLRLGFEVYGRPEAAPFDAVVSADTSKLPQEERKRLLKDGGVTIHAYPNKWGVFPSQKPMGFLWPLIPASWLALELERHAAK